MDPEAEIGLAIIGTNRLAEHLAALDRLGGVRIFGLPEGKTGPEEYRRLLCCQKVHLAVICTSLREREYWVVQAAGAGKHVFCESPLTSSFTKTRQLVSLCARSSVALALAADVRFGELEGVVRQGLDERKIGPLLFVDLKVSVSQNWLRGTREGVLLRYGLPFLSLLVSRFGVVDSVYARSRSLGLNRPEEDLALAQMRFKNGLEGVFQINGLGDVAQVCLQVYGQHGKIVYTTPLEEACPQGLRLQYEDFLQALKQGREPFFSGVRVLEGMHCLAWIQQSARLDREVYRSEVTLG